MARRRRKPRRAGKIYNHDRGDGWILTTIGERDFDFGNEGEYKLELVLYYTDTGEVETHTLKHRSYDSNSPVDSFLTGYLDVGAKLGPYHGEKPQPSADFEAQPRAVRMQRHATDIYAALGDVRGMSEAMAVRAAEEFGSTWSEKTEADTWAERVQGVGSGRAASFAEALQ